MFRFVSAKSIGSVAAATLVAGLLAFSTSAVPEAKADAQVKETLQQPSAKGDRLPARVKGSACSSHGWPNYEQACQFDLRRSAGEAGTVRVIALR